jgi:hypothetical protein
MAVNGHNMAPDGARSSYEPPMLRITGNAAQIAALSNRPIKRPTAIIGCPHMAVPEQAKLVQGYTLSYGQRATEKVI